MTKEWLENILVKSKYIVENEHVVDGAVRFLSHEIGKQPAQASHGDAGLRASELLRKLRMSLQCEVVELAFDYFLVHRSC